MLEDRQLASDLYELLPLPLIFCSIFLNFFFLVVPPPSSNFWMRSFTLLLVVLRSDMVELLWTTLCWVLSFLPPPLSNRDEWTRAAGDECIEEEGSNSPPDIMVVNAVCFIGIIVTYSLLVIVIWMSNLLWVKQLKQHHTPKMKWWRPYPWMALCYLCFICRLSWWTRYIRTLLHHSHSSYLSSIIDDDACGRPLLDATGGERVMAGRFCDSRGKASLWVP